MEPLSIWESIALVALGVLVVLWFRPGLKAAMEKSRNADQQDWQSLVMPLGLVVLFVLLLIALARSTSTSSKHDAEFKDEITTWNEIAQAPLADAPRYGNRRNCLS